MILAKKHGPGRWCERTDVSRSLESGRDGYGLDSHREIRRQSTRSNDVGHQDYSDFACPGDGSHKGEALGTELWML